MDAVAFIPIENVVQAEMVYKVGTEFCENVLWFKFAGRPTPANLIGLKDMLLAWYNTDVQPYQAGEAVLNKLKFVDMTAPNGIYLEFPVLTDNQGGNVSAILPSNVTVAIKHLTGFTGRSYRGRTYWIGLAEGMVTGDGLNAGVAANLVTSFDNLIAAAAANSSPWVVVTRYENKQPRLVGGANTIISNSCDGIIDSQRRRLAGRGS